MRIILFITIYLFTFTTTYLFASNNFTFKKLDVDVGISRVRSIYRCHNDFLWIGNNDVGLMRYDSYEIKRFLHDDNDTLSISDNGIITIFEDSRNNLWIGTDNGLNRYLEKTGQFIRYFYSNPRDSIKKGSYINSIAEGPDSTVWVCSRNGLYKYNPSRDEFKIYNISNSAYWNNFMDIDFTSDGIAWILLGTNGIYQFNIQKEEFIHFKDTNTNATYSYFKNIYIDNHDKIWFSVSSNGFG